MLKSKLDSGSPCLVHYVDLEHVTPRVSHNNSLLSFVLSLQEADEFMFDTIGFQGVPKRVVVNGVERLHEVLRRNPHFDTPLMAFLFNHPVRRYVIWRLVRTPEPSLIFGLNLPKPGIKSVIQDGRKKFVQRWQNTTGRQSPTSSSFLFFVDNFYSYSATCFWSTTFLF